MDMKSTPGVKWQRPIPPAPRSHNLDSGLNMGALGSGRGLKRHGALVGSTWPEFQFKRSHGDPSRDPNSCSLRLVKFWFETITFGYLVRDHFVVTSEYLVLTSDYLVLLSA